MLVSVDQFGDMKRLVVTKALSVRDQNRDIVVIASRSAGK
jgi:hypothetical protein